MIRRGLLGLLGLMFVGGSVAQATPMGIGVGAVLGEPLGFTVGYRWEENMAVQVVNGWSVGGKGLHLSGDFLYTVTEIPSDEGMGLNYPVYMGAGIRIRMAGPDTPAYEAKGSVGLRFPIVAAVTPDHIPLEVFFEMVPIWILFPESHPGFDGGIGARVYF
ncbi:MAG: hypothetical protein CL930_00995 [Deltaproteobacteria bacterium]|jgi:hypothetical protein|nr:hypothetical protein [Deltaproteobacteria bacterium]|tara:strand:- start:281 stop:763 length:483 start_codon:yes stop_codon:yes gene_type:complete